MATSLEIRNDLSRVLELDLVGPSPGHSLEREALDTAPSRFYLTGFLVPHEANEDWKSAGDGQEELDQGSDGRKGDGHDEPTKDKASGRKVFFPSTLGVSVCVGNETRGLDVTVTWGDYVRVVEKKEDGKDGPGHWQREPRRVVVPVPVETRTHELSGHKGVRLSVVVRQLKTKNGASELLNGVRLVSVFLVNDRRPHGDGEAKNQLFLFQASLELKCAEGFVPRPNLRGVDSSDLDECIADLQYKDAFEYAVGHGVSTRCVVVGDRCAEVHTTWMPSAEVEKVVAAAVPGDFDMKRLADCASAAEVSEKLKPLADAYGKWIAQQDIDGLKGQRADVAKTLLANATAVQKRILDGLEVLKDPDALRAFRLANAAMESQARQRGKLFSPPNTAAPAWRPFQLAFILMNLRGVVDPTHADRERVDLLFFPTGGGKTEAYLGLAAFTLLLRRLKNPGLSSAGVSVLMRYTLRLLTLDQLQRAATLVCALELIRQASPKDLGEWPFEIGLWVGRAATPNRMGKKGDRDEYSARKRTQAYQRNTREPLPVPLESCPWCGAPLSKDSFQLVPNPDEPKDLRILCVNRGACDFAGKALPILTVDEPIYRRLPCFLIATLDKFAALPWEGRVGGLFGKVDRYDADGFYGACDEGQGARLRTPLLPPDLIIQDELHLISGPLGTVAGFYEAAIEALSSRTVDNKVIRPKLVASTATVRRAERQIQELFARKTVEVFPAPGIDRGDSFFAVTVAPSTKPARLYLGIAAPGRSLKVVLLRTYLALVAAAQRHFMAEGGEVASANPADPYMTLLGYFNSLRDLGGSRRIIEDEVVSHADSMAVKRRRRGEQTAPDFANRRINSNVVELTSRESNADVARAKRRLERSFKDKDERVDVAIATNMISVGLDITRLGLMVVLGQPKTTSEYIQATSRVGRDENRPGLVVTLLNVHKPRDRSHFERFEYFHRTFYRSVEATSVTPFSPRAIDRALAGAVVGLARHGDLKMTAPRQAIFMSTHRSHLAWVGEALKDRAARAGHPADGQMLANRVANLLDDWQQIAQEQAKDNAGLQYQRELGADPPLLHTPLDPELVNLDDRRKRFRANRSLRDIEPSVNLFIHLPGSHARLEDD